MNPHFEGNTMANALRGQTEIALGKPHTPVRLLHFLSARAGRYFIDAYGDHIYEIRRADCPDAVLWETGIRRRGHKIGVANAFYTLDDAVEHLQAEARKRGGRA
jgi:hypothetical protein